MYARRQIWYWKKNYVGSSWEIKGLSYIEENNIFAFWFQFIIPVDVSLTLMMSNKIRLKSFNTISYSPDNADNS